MTPPPPESRPDAGPDGFEALRRARRLGASGLRRVLLGLLLRHAMRLASAAALAILFGGVIMGAPLSGAMLAACASGLVAVALAGRLADRWAAGEEMRISVAMRDAAADRLGAMPQSTLRALSAGALSVTMQRSPDAVAKLVIGHRAATLMMAAGPCIAAAALAIVSWQAALLMLAVTPVMILFFILVGDAIRNHAARQEQAFAKLSGQFADRIRTLPTILANDALAREESRLSRRLDDYVSRTMGVLRIAFLNAALIDFFASLSIAMLAVFLGLGHLGLAAIPGFHGLELWQSLFILLVAPDYFAPFRRFAEQYHAKAEGIAAAEALDRMLNTAAPAVTLPAVDRAFTALALPACGLVVLTGPSGSGKSTLLRRIAGIEAGFASCLPADPAWIATDGFVPAGTLARAIDDGFAQQSFSDLRRAAAAVGLLDDAALPGGLSACIADGGANLSGGQRLRIGAARALLATGPVVADEPTAKLDPATAALIRSVLLTIARSRLVIAASHDAELVVRADRTIDLSGHDVFEVAA